MPFPQIHNVVLCEDMRQESRGLSTLLGFFGVLPHVEVIVRDFAQPVRLGFLFLGGPGDGQFQVRLRIRTSQGQEVMATGNLAMAVAPGTRTNIALQLMPGPVLPGSDTYRVELLNGTDVAYTSTFVVRQAGPGELPP
jgi:hypothetical protein